MSKNIYFVRHGESEFNKARKWAGSTDTPLTDIGKSQAKKAGQRLKEKGIRVDVIISSPKQRAYDTAKLIASEIGYDEKDIIVDDNLLERDFGVLEGRKDLRVATKYALSEKAIDSYEKVEKLENLQKRADKVLSTILDMDHKHILLVGHGAHGRALRRSAKKFPLHVRGKSFRNAEIEKLL